MESWTVPSITNTILFYCGKKKKYNSININNLLAHSWTVPSITNTILFYCGKKKKKEKI